MPAPKEKHPRLSPLLFDRARELHHPLTPAEHKVWAAVRNNQLGFKIRRQQVIGRFIADFYCAQSKLVIEIDGDTHADPGQTAYDLARTEWLEAQGYHVIRFNNLEVHTNLAGVVQKLQEECRRLARD